MERSEVYCTNCTGSFVAELDLGLNGNHEITCPLCDHVHYRVVEDGRVTEDRWRSSAGPTYVVNTFTLVMAPSASSSGSTYLAQSWLNTTPTTYSS